jgi:hypothetical protein
MIFLLLSVSGEATCVCICACGCGRDPHRPGVMPLSQLPGCPRHAAVIGLRRGRVDDPPVGRLIPACPGD